MEDEPSTDSQAPRTQPEDRAEEPSTELVVVLSIASPPRRTRARGPVDGLFPPRVLFHLPAQFYDSDQIDLCLVPCHAWLIASAETLPSRRRGPEAHAARDCMRVGTRVRQDA